MKKKICTALFAHSIGKLKTVETTKEFIHKVCTTCGYEEYLPHSNSSVAYVNNIIVQRKKWSADDNRKELLQPLNQDGSVNDDFTSAFGYNPHDPRTKKQTPKFQGGEL